MTPTTLLSRLATLPPDPAQVPLPGLRPLTRCEPSRLLRGSYRDLDLLRAVEPCRDGRGGCGGDGDGGGQGRLF